MAAMRSFVLILCATCAMPVAGCSDAPPAPPTRAEAAVETCSASVHGAVDKRNAKTGLRWFASAITRWGDIDEGVDSCVATKGVAVSRPCTDEERRRGGPSLVVTARGISCTDPGRS